MAPTGKGTLGVGQLESRPQKKSFSRLRVILPLHSGRGANSQSLPLPALTSSTDEFSFWPLPDRKLDWKHPDGLLELALFIRQGN